VQPVQLLAGLREVAPQAWAVSATRRDPRFEQLGKGPAQADAKNSCPDIFVAFSAADLALLWSLGLPAIPPTGLERLAGEYIDWFTSSLTLPVEEGQEFVRQSGLVLVNWSPALLRRVDYPQIQEIERHFAQIREYIGDDFCGPLRWTPSDWDYEAFQFVLQYGRPKDLADRVRWNAGDVLSVVPEADTPKQSYSDAFATWARQHIDLPDVGIRQRNWEQLQRSQEEELIAPLVERAMTEPDVLARGLWHSLAHTSRVLHSHAAKISLRLTRNVSLQSWQTREILGEPEFRQFITLTDRLLALTKSIRQCPKKKPKLRASSPQQLPVNDSKQWD
jgi:hypothetical protein